MARKVFIAGNWKMNKTAAETRELCKALKEKFADVCPNCVDGGGDCDDYFKMMDNLVAKLSDALAK